MARIDQSSFYSKEAAGYESTRYGTRYGRLFRAVHRSTLKQLLPKSQYSLDVATGTGQMLPVLADATTTLVAQDLTPEMLQEAKALNMKHPNITYIVGDAMRLPFPDETFDVVASSRFLHLFNLESQRLLLAEMSRVAKPGGLVIVDFYSADARRFFSIPIAIYRWLLRKRPENDFRIGIKQAREMALSCNLQIEYLRGLGNFILVPLLWLPNKTVQRIAISLGKHLPSLSEQFMIRAKKS